MRNVRMTLSYDGTGFHGWQVQPGLRTIQGELEQALQRILDHQITLIGSGRTDAGVHAHAQVANFHTGRSIDTDALQRAVNAILPPEVRVTEVLEADPAFHARFSAIEKTYEYHVWREAVVPPFQQRYVYGFAGPLDADAVDLATASLIGEHDFTSFCAASTETEDRRRAVREAVWSREDSAWVFRISANGFLQHMVRTIVGTLLDVGRGRISAGRIPEILEARDRNLAGRTAPAQGLHLVEVRY